MFRFFLDHLQGVSGNSKSRRYSCTVTRKYNAKRSIVVVVVVAVVVDVLVEVHTLHFFGSTKVDTFVSR